MASVTPKQYDPRGPRPLERIAPMHIAYGACCLLDRATASYERVYCAVTSPNFPPMSTAIGDFHFTTADLTYSMDTFEEKILRPAVDNLVAEMGKAGLAWDTDLLMGKPPFVETAETLVFQERVDNPRHGQSLLVVVYRNPMFGIIEGPEYRGQLHVRFALRPSTARRVSALRSIEILAERNIEEALVA